MSEDDIKEVQSQIVEDAKQRYRFNSIEDEGDDPAKPFKKIGGHEKEGEGEGEEGEGGPELGGLEDLGKGGKGGEGGGEEELGGIEPGEGGGEGPEGLVKETKLKRDQSGEHKASSHPFGEDPLGQDELDAKPKKNSEGKPKSQIAHNFEGGSPIHLKEGKPRKVVLPADKKKLNDEIINNLAEFLKKTSDDTKKELISENSITGSKSLLDESGILE